MPTVFTTDNAGAYRANCQRRHCLPRLLPTTPVPTALISHDAIAKREHCQRRLCLPRPPLTLLSAIAPTSDVPGAYRNHCRRRSCPLLLTELSLDRPVSLTRSLRVSRLFTALVDCALINQRASSKNLLKRDFSVACALIGRLV